MNQLKHSTARQKWLECGCELFAQDGAEGLQVERLARILKLNKSGFYHYFSDPEIFLNTLFKHHRDQARQMALHIQECKLLDPDYFKVIVKFKLFVLVQGKLISRSNNLLHYEVFKEAREVTKIELLPLWRRTFFLPDSQEVVLSHLSLFDNAFHAQANINNITYEFLHQMKTDNMTMMREVFEYQYARRKGMPAENEKIDDDCFATIKELTLT